MDRSIDEIQRHERMATWRDFAAPLAHLSIRSGWRVLDVGCGSGAASRLIARSCEPEFVVGLDVNPSYAAAAQRIATERGVPNLRFATGDARQLPFGNGAFDCVWAAFVVEYLAAELDLVLRERTLAVRSADRISAWNG